MGRSERSKRDGAGRGGEGTGAGGVIAPGALPDATLRSLLLEELARGPGYGYGLARAIEQRRGGQLTKQPEVLYPVLHKLELEGLASGAWGQGENGRPRRTYTITPKGRRQADRLARERKQGQAQPGTLATEQGEVKR